MNVYSFFRLLNFKIKQFEKAASNPFEKRNKPITIIWIEEYENNYSDKS